MKYLLQLTGKRKHDKTTVPTELLLPYLYRNTPRLGSGIVCNYAGPQQISLFRVTISLDPLSLNAIKRVTSDVGTKGKLSRRNLKNNVKFTLDNVPISLNVH